ncbi:UNVERIFIED_CONTAM: carboxypeptidase-like regulatory domain-containing protein, partial [Salmonella enterica subsp. enterica serovar Weltevreden]
MDQKVQQQQITGRVTDENGAPIPGASVKVKGTNNGVVRDQNGRFALTAESKDILVFSYIGYTSVELCAA